MAEDRDTITSEDVTEPTKRIVIPAGRKMTPEEHGREMFAEHQARTEQQRAFLEEHGIKAPGRPTAKVEQAWHPARTRRLEHVTWLFNVIDAEATGATIRVARHMAVCFGDDASSPTESQLAELAGITDRGARKALTWLVEQGFLVRQRADDGDLRRNVYLPRER